MRQIANIATFTLSFAALLGTAVPGMLSAQDQQAAPPSYDQTQAPPQDQQSNPPNRGWRRVGDPAATDNQAPQGDPNNPGWQNQQPPASNGPVANPAYTGQPLPPNYDANQAPQYPPQGQYPQGQYPPQGQYGRPGQYGPPRTYQNAPPQQPVAQKPVPASLTIKPGTYVTVRVNQVLSSDHNHVGDAFASTLVKPVVVDGVVVAERGQTIGGRVAEAKKAGRVEGVSKLGIELTDLSLADGQNVPLKSALISRDGPTSVGRDVGAIATTTGVGAAAGAAADWGRGAAIGAGAGAAVGIVGVLLTRGRPTIIYPEQVLTFRVENAITISTERAPQAFRWVDPSDYDQPQDLQRRPPPSMRVAGPGYYGAPAPYYGPAYYPYYWGPGFGVYYGGGGYYRGGRR